MDQSDVFIDYLIPNMKIKEELTFTNYPPPSNPTSLTPATPSPISPSNFPPSSTFFPSNFQPKASSFPWQSSSSLLSPAPSLLGSSQEELALCRPWKYDVHPTSMLLTYNSILINLTTCCRNQILKMPQIKRNSRKTT